MDTIDGEVGDLFQNSMKITFGIDSVELGRTDKRVDRGGSLSAGIGAAE